MQSLLLRLLMPWLRTAQLAMNKLTDSPRRRYSYQNSVLSTVINQSTSVVVDANDCVEHLSFQSRLVVLTCFTIFVYILVKLFQQTHAFMRVGQLHHVIMGHIENLAKNSYCTNVAVLLKSDFQRWPTKQRLNV